MPMNRSRCLTAAIIFAMLSVPFARALINPKFRPTHLVKESTLIASVGLKEGESKDIYLAEIRQVLKGKTDLKSFRLDLTKARDTQNADALRALAAQGKPALFFASEKPAQGGEPARNLALLHAGGAWGVFYGKAGGWLFDCIDTGKQGIWAGGTDMLRRAVDYILEDEDADLPADEGAQWSAEPQKIAALDGAIRAIRPIDLAGDGNTVLFVARDKGDRLLACDSKGRKFTDITASRDLQSKSQEYAWGDFSGQGRLDLISFDGKAFSLHAQQADGRFQSRTLDLGGALANGCIGMAALDAGVKGRSGLLVSGSGLPVLVTLGAEGRQTLTELQAPGVDLGKLGKAGQCLVADFDGDGTADVLALREGGSIWFRGLMPGGFAPGVACAVKPGRGATRACVGDFDGDGRLDVFCVNTEGTSLWENEGDGKFANQFPFTGELLYNSQPGGNDCFVGDINNDGRQDILIAYGATSTGLKAPQIFFNRGFRCFGAGHLMSVAERKLLPSANHAQDGQQAACLGDFDGDGAQDMILALSNGEIWSFFRENGDGDARLASAFLRVGGPSMGPVVVTGWIGKRCMGAWNVVPGVSHACFGRNDAGPVTLKWRLPGGKEQQKEILLEKGGRVNVEIK